MQFAAEHHHLFRRDYRRRIIGGCLLLWAFLMLATPRVPHSPAHHLFADMRNLFGVPNTLNVLTCFPFLLVGVPSLVLCLSGTCFGISLKGEMWGWALFYAGIAAAAFGSAYYHLKPDDDRFIWDNLPVMIAIASLLSNLVIERVDERTGITCLFSLLTLVLVSIACERTFNDLRLCMMFNFVPCIVIPALVFLFPPKYTHSRFWFLAVGFYLLSRIEALADKKVYGVNRYFISGHSLEHLCLAMIPLILSIMLWLRSIRIARAQSTNNNPLLNMLPWSHYAQKIFGTQRTINTANGHLLETDPDNLAEETFREKKIGKSYKQQEGLLSRLTKFWIDFVRDTNTAINNQHSWLLECIAI